jgi:hypothetical protein
MADQTVGNNDFGGYARRVPLTQAFPGAVPESGTAGEPKGDTWQAWQQGAAMTAEPTVNTAPGHVANGIDSYPAESADPFPGFRPQQGAGYASDGW